MMICNFCKRTSQEVSKMVAGPDANICNWCVLLSLDALGRIDGEEHAMRRAMEAVAANMSRASREMAEAFKIMRSVGMNRRTLITCYWCDGTFPESEIKEHVGQCEKHPAVIALRDARKSPSRKGRSR